MPKTHRVILRGTRHADAEGHQEVGYGGDAGCT